LVVNALWYDRPVVSKVGKSVQEGAAVENGRDRLVELSPASLVLLFGLVTLAAAHGVSVLVIRPPLVEMLDHNGLDPDIRRRLAVMTIVLTGIITTAFWFLCRGLPGRGAIPLEQSEVVRRLRVFWPISLIGAVPYVFSTSVWSQSPILLYLLTCVVVGACVVIAEPPRWILSVFSGTSSTGPRGTLVILLLMIGAYSAYVSYHTVMQHHALETRAYDLGIAANTFWNSTHGDLFASSMAPSGNHLAFHTSFIFLPAFPIYALLPFTETLLVLQSIALALAALPLYLVGRRMLHSGQAALVICAIYLLHPAVAGANFYDFHELAFAPVLVFSAWLFFELDRPIAYWLAIVLLLSVKEDMALVVLLIGLVVCLSGRRRLGLVTMAAGAGAYVVLQHLVIPHVAGEFHSYSWYFADMIPDGGGPSALPATVIANPLFSLKFALSPEKVLYSLQMLAPLGFLCLGTTRGVVLLGYGLFASLLASRPPLYQLGFQYSLTTIACGAIGAVIMLAKMSPQPRSRALVFAAAMSLITCFHYGMVYPRHNLTGGFRTVDFRYTDQQRERYREVTELVSMIPRDASVTASEMLVPHVAQRRHVETTRYAADHPGRNNDYLFLHRDTAKREQKKLRAERKYEIVHEGKYVILLKKSALIFPSIR